MYHLKIFKIKTKKSIKPKLAAKLSNRIFFKNIALSIAATFPVALSTKTFIFAS